LNRYACENIDKHIQYISQTHLFNSQYISLNEDNVEKIDKSIYNLFHFGTFYFFTSTSIQLTLRM